MSDDDAHPVLVVDDDPDIVETLSLILGQLGYPALVAHNGREALDELRGGARPSVILLDLMMPTMNGWEFCAEKAADPELASLPVVILTGDGHAEEKAASLGASGHLQKPVDLEAILREVRYYRGSIPPEPTISRD